MIYLFYWFLFPVPMMTNLKLLVKCGYEMYELFFFGYIQQSYESSAEPHFIGAIVPPSTLSNWVSELKRKCKSAI